MNDSTVKVIAKRNYILVCKFWDLLEGDQQLDWYLNGNLIKKIDTRFQITQLSSFKDNSTFCSLELQVNNEIDEIYSCGFKGLLKSIKLETYTGIYQTFYMD